MKKKFKILNNNRFGLKLKWIFLFFPPPPISSSSLISLYENQNELYKRNQRIISFFFLNLEKFVVFFQHPRLFWIKKSFFLSYFFFVSHLCVKKFFNKSLPAYLGSFVVEKYFAIIPPIVKKNEESINWSDQYIINVYFVFRISIFNCW